MLVREFLTDDDRVIDRKVLIYGRLEVDDTHAGGGEKDIYKRKRTSEKAVGVKLLGDVS